MELKLNWLDLHSRQSYAECKQDRTRGEPNLTILDHWGSAKKFTTLTMECNILTDQFPS